MDWNINGNLMRFLLSPERISERNKSVKRVTGLFQNHRCLKKKHLKAHDVFDDGAFCESRPSCRLWHFSLWRRWHDRSLCRCNSGLIGDRMRTGRHWKEVEAVLLVGAHPQNPEVTQRG